MVERFGLGDILFNPKDAKVDIVLVHGLGGDRIKTWTSPATEESDSHFWAKEFLPKNCPTARIMSFGYDASFAHFYPLYGPKNIPIGTTLDDHSAALFLALSNVRAKTETPPTRPIIFVAHSLGGLVCANALSRQHGSNAANVSLVGSTLGVIFLGTPFEGSEKASWGTRGLKFIKAFTTINDLKMKDLEERSAKLISINDNFYKFIKLRDQSKSHLNVACFFESWETKGGFGIIVPKSSATVVRYDPIPIEATHSGMCKFAGSDRNGYKNIAETLSQWIKKLDDPNAADELPPSVKSEVHYNAPFTNAGGAVIATAVGFTENAVSIVGSRDFHYTASPVPEPNSKPSESQRRELRQDAKD